MNILIVGSGGREHTLALKISQSKHCSNLFVAPGNGGTALCATNIPIGVSDIFALKSFCIDNQVDLVVVGPEVPLVEGITDAFRADDISHIGIIGPSAYAAKLEGSKAFAKKFMKKYKIPTAGYIEVTAENLTEGMQFLDKIQTPYVLKADGLAAGKGVLIIDDIAEAKAELNEMLSGKFGKASSTVVIEEFLSGIEFSVFVLTDGRDYILLPEAKDYKRIGEGDTGLNTGGMGAISPVPFVTEALWQKVISRIVQPTINGLKEEEMDYIGFVFFGLINVGGDPFVIEYNCRLGDPETEVIIPRIEDDFVDVLLYALRGELKNKKLRITNQSAATVMLVAGGYPGVFEKDKIITGIDETNGSIIFHAGTLVKNEQIVTNGGRVIAVTTLHEKFEEAVKISLQNAEKIKFEGKNFRKDIGFDL